MRITLVVPPVAMFGGVRVIAICAKMLEFVRGVVVVSPRVRQFLQGRNLSHCLIVYVVLTAVALCGKVSRTACALFW